MKTLLTWCIILTLFFVGVKSCSKSNSNQDSPSKEIETPNPNELSHEGCGAVLISKVTGSIQDPTLKETSGLVASQRYPGVFYAIQDSLSPDFVYAIFQNGTNLGKIKLDGIKMRDFEDISLGASPNKNKDYIYVADIGNNYDGHCRGINYPNMSVYMFMEPNREDFGMFSNGTVHIPLANVINFELENPYVTGLKVCNDSTKQDIETLFVDPLSKDVYLVQKNKQNRNSLATIYKFTIPEDLDGTVIHVKLQDVGKVPAVKGPISKNLKQSKLDRVAAFGEDRDGKGSIWPMFITAGDMSRDGKNIILRNYDGGRMWTRSPEQSVEEAIMENESCELVLRAEPQGESVALKHDNTGFYTTSESQEHDDEGSTKSGSPIYYYPFL